MFCHIFEHRSRREILHFRSEGSCTAQSSWSRGGISPTADVLPAALGDGVSSKFLVFLLNPGTELVSEAGKSHCPVLYENWLALLVQQLVLPDPKYLLNCESHPGSPEGCLWFGDGFSI